MQTLSALAAAAAAILWLAVRAYRRRGRPGCGGECACPSSELRDKVGRPR